MSQQEQQRPPSTFPPGFFYIKSQRYSALTMDVDDGSMLKDANILVWSKKDVDNVNQLWAYDDGFLVNKKSGLVIDIRGGDVKAGKSIIQYVRKGVRARNQEWRFIDGYICPASNERLALDLESTNASPGTNVILASRNMQRPSQQWALVEYNPPHLKNIHTLLLPLTDEERKAQQQIGIRLSNLADWHRLVYKEKSKEVSDREIAGAAAFEAIRLYIQQCKSTKQPIKNDQALASISSLVTKEIAKLTSDHAMTEEKSTIERSAQAAADSYFSREYAAAA
ncbi:ricin B lectin domain-containing protein [Umbelopsis sp. PMI_123]|nr:ricin B lectin domain-containing protein [Umbelopsis sp. PMI_123]